MSITRIATAFVFATFAFIATDASAQQDQPTRRGAVNISTALIPSGFDNSEPRAVISGLFPNSCYQFDGAEVAHLDATSHEVRTYAKIRAGYCLMVMVPFSEEVALGSFASGHHTVRFVNADGSQIEKQIDVE